MPIYTYHCEKCGHQFDIFQHFTDDTLTQCPECGEQTLHKVYSPVGIVFKGSGFYSTDNRSPSGQTPQHHESSAVSEIPHSEESAENAPSSKAESRTNEPEKKAAPKAAESKSESSKQNSDS